MLGNREKASGYLRDTLRRHIDIGHAWGMALDLYWLNGLAVDRGRREYAHHVGGGCGLTSVLNFEEHLDGSRKRKRERRTPSGN